MIPPIKIFTAQQIRAADAYTIEHEPISSIDLMERAAIKCVDWITKHYQLTTKFKVFCGLGNNGGDGLAIARLLTVSKFDVQIFILRHSDKYSKDFEANLKRLELIQEIKIFEITSIEALNNKIISNHADNSTANDVVIDAIFGTGLTKEISGFVADCIKALNQKKSEIISIDVPSGLFSDAHSNPNSAIIKATTTLSFQFPKLASVFAENADFVGNFEILDIGLSQKYIEETPTNHFYLTKNFVQRLLKPRKKFSHKGTYGHGLIIAGSYGKIGAALLAGNACLRSGCGLLTIYVPKCGYNIIQNGIPEAMVLTDSEDKIFSENIYADAFSAIGIGPGIGTHEHTQLAFKNFLKNNIKPLVIDADALNILSLNKELLSLLQPDSILTPHPKEFERLTQKPKNDFERHALQINFSITHKVFVILKGAHTCITTPDGKSFFNSTGDPGMAKGGSGDILTGILTSLLAQNYTPLETCLLGVYVHGLAGDIAKKNKGEIGMISGDIIQFLPNAFLNLQE